MKKNRVLIVVMAALVAAGFTAVYLTPSGQSQNKSAPAKSGEEIPVVDIYAPESDDPLTKDLQRNRGRKYNTGVPLEDSLNRNQTSLIFP